MEKDFEILSDYFLTMEKITSLIVNGRNKEAKLFSEAKTEDGTTVKEIIKTWSGLSSDEFFDLAEKIPSIFKDVKELRKPDIRIIKDVQDKGRKNRLNHEKIVFSSLHTIFGKGVITVSGNTILGLDFPFDEEAHFRSIKEKWPNAVRDDDNAMTKKIRDSIFSDKEKGLKEMEIFLSGTDFQIRVWETLSGIPLTEKISYSEIAVAIGVEGSARAVGNAVGSNPITYLIPCHRVTPKSGGLGGFGCGPAKKLAMLIYEAARIQGENHKKTSFPGPVNGV